MIFGSPFGLVNSQVSNPTTYHTKHTDDDYWFNFVTVFNNHREFMSISSDLIYADKSISRWYGEGGYWINM